MAMAVNIPMIMMTTVTSIKENPFLFLSILFPVFMPYIILNEHINAFEKFFSQIILGAASDGLLGFPRDNFIQLLDDTPKSTDHLVGDNKRDDQRKKEYRTHQDHYRIGKLIDKIFHAR